MTSWPTAGARGGPLVEIRLANRTTEQTRRSRQRTWRSASTTSAWSAWPSRLAASRWPPGSTTSGSSTATRSSAGSARGRRRLRHACSRSTGRDVASALDRGGLAPVPPGPRSQARPIEGWLVRVEWRSAPGLDPRDVDQAEGALIALTDASLTLATPYAGDLDDPPRPAQAGDQGPRPGGPDRPRPNLAPPRQQHVSKHSPTLLDPPLPEGGTPGTSVLTLDRVPEGDAASDRPRRRPSRRRDRTAPQFSELVRRGETSDQPEGQRRAGRLPQPPHHDEQRGPRANPAADPRRTAQGRRQHAPDRPGRQAGEPEELDDLGILCIAVEFEPADRKP